MMVVKKHPFHMVDMSPWPLSTSIGALVMTTGLVKWFNQFNINLLIIGLLITVISSFQWWRDISRESTYQGLHTKKVLSGMKLGMVLFIISEVFFFLSFFWAFFHSSLSPSVELGMQWPPMGIQPFNPMQIPLLNTIILLSSGVSVTYTHHSILEKTMTHSKKSLMLTVILGLYFSCLQALEYWEAPFSMADSVYGSTFFMATGFHGIHVIVGTTFLFISLIRLMKNHFSSYHHFGFEAAAWYWHFVDVVWLFLYINVYWWGA
uniref:Cytochrome c oxidase subunit 3 n=1 Tax=Allacma fusca TaxID=39272 RepID=A0A7D5BNQ9_9HEXA|nr:cytochrome c oxidase subunit III [Allacma fusca]